MIIPQSEIKTPAPGKDTRGSHLRNIFRNRFGHFRAGWRIFFYFCFGFSLYFAFDAILPSKLGPSVEDPLISLRMFLLYGCTAGFLIFSAWISLRWIDRRPFVLIGVNPNRYNIQTFLIGFAAGAAIIITAFFIQWGAGFIAVQSFSFGNLFNMSIWKYFLILFLVSWVEELLFRGYMLFALTEGTRVWIAVLFTSILFSVGHWDNNNFVWTGSLSLFVFGVMCAVAVLKTRSIWIAVGLHLSWNWIQGPVLGMNVSGRTFYSSLFYSLPQGPEIFSGGTFGAEASLITSILAMIVLLLLVKTKRLKTTRSQQKLWDCYPAGFGIHPHSCARFNDA